MVAAGGIPSTSAAQSAEWFDPTHGTACAKASDCVAGFCVDGICCESACTTPCKQCVVKNGLGSCLFIAAGVQDTYPPKACDGTKACDGKGGCIKASGQTCNQNNECATGYCVDGICCKSSGCGECQSCAMAGSLGTCANIPALQPDVNATPTPCTSPKFCNGKGACKSGIGQQCSLGTDCASSSCADGVCCDTDCLETCKSCGLSATLGTCSLLPKNAEDTNAPTKCAVTGACDGAGTCKKVKGQGCNTGTDCVTGMCADSVCCDQKCDGECKTCNLSTSPGTCTLVPSGVTDTNATKPCAGSKVCDGAGKCLTIQGKACSSATDCLAGFCKDGVCCNTACDQQCESCALSSSVGTCAAIPANTFSKDDCQGAHTKCGGLCNSQKKCDYPTVGTLCGTCMGCDGSGKCTKTPLDDSSCGVIDCDQLDTKCRDYLDLTAYRCESLGNCKTANTTTTCTKYTDTCTDAGPKDLGAADKAQGKEAGATPDQASSTPDTGATTPPAGGGEDDGCSVSGVTGPDGSRGGTQGIPYLVLLLLALRFRWNGKSRLPTR